MLRIKNAIRPEVRVVPLPWDSSFLGFPVGRLEERRLTREALHRALGVFHADGGRLTYWPSDPEHLPSQEAAAAEGGRLVDRKTRFHHDLRTEIVCATNASPVWPWDGSGPDSHLRSLAIQAGAHSRFRLDPDLPAGCAEELYRLWIDRSVQGELADAVLVARGRGLVSGLITLSARNGIGEIGLLAVDEASRGRGTGSALIAAGLAWFRDRGCRSAEVVTQGGNQAACRLYARCGFRISQVDAFYHFWRRPG